MKKQKMRLVGIDSEAHCSLGKAVFIAREAARAQLTVVEQVRKHNRRVARAHSEKNELVG